MSMTQEEIEALMNESADIAPATDSIDDSIENEDKEQNDSKTVKKSDENISTVDETGLINKADIADNVNGEDSNVDFATLIGEQVDSGIYPLPVEKEHKVVNQLNEVAEDSEEKATKIFDVLSFILDENAKIKEDVKNIEIFVEQQISLLTALSTKFPNISVIKENLASAQSLNQATESIVSKMEEENSQIFNAMDLMQFHDINRQKIERVMAVIRKLSIYLNGLFEDNSDKPEVQIAKHISGDSSDTVENDDLDALIAEFGN
jgi:hypothetical protein